MSESIDLSAAAAALGRRGGKVKSQAKAEAAARNARRPRPNRRKPRQPEDGQRGEK